MREVAGDGMRIASLVRDVVDKLSKGRLFARHGFDDHGAGLGMGVKLSSTCRWIVLRLMNISWIRWAVSCAAGSDQLVNRSRFRACAI